MRSGGNHSTKSKLKDRKLKMYSDDEVGYGKPPKSGQFKPGQSGNPRGRPKGARNVNTLMQRELARKVVASVDGERKSISALDVIVRQLIQDGLKGKASDRLKVLAAIDKYCPQILEEDLTPSTIEVLFVSPEGHPDDLMPTDEERAFLRKALKERRAEEKKKRENDETDGWEFLK